MKIIFLFLTTFSFIFATINLDIQNTPLFDVTTKNAKIQIPDLSIGQSGIVIKNIDTNSIILSQAVVVASNQNDSTIEFINTHILPQDAIPTSNLKPQNDDTFILNHLYNTSLIIVPNLKAKTLIQKLYPNQNFLNEDFFASHLKVQNIPLPQKKDISSFAQSKQIGTIFLMVENNLYILDSISFKIIDTVSISNDDLTTHSPFFTKIENIEQAFWDFGAEEIENYNEYYLELLEIKQ
ncbi:MAG: plasminogen-binding N-terminal domain-containing protein [Arcobacteraceae bacterium]